MRRVGIGYADDRVFKPADVRGLGHLANMAALVLLLTVETRRWRVLVLPRHIRRASGASLQRYLLNIKQEVHNVTITHNIFFAFGS